MEYLVAILVVVLMVGVLYKFAKQVLIGIIGAAILGVISYTITAAFGEDVMIPSVIFMAFFGFIIGIKIANSID